MSVHLHYYTQLVRRRWWSIPTLTCKCGRRANEGDDWSDYQRQDEEQDRRLRESLQPWIDPAP
jgi:hypothetical protein